MISFTKVNTGAIHWQVKIVKTVPGNENLDGQVDFDKKVIYLRNVDDVSLIINFFHELYHAILFDALGSYANDNRNADEMIEVLSMGLYRAIVNNKDVFAKIIEEIIKGVDSNDKEKEKKKKRKRKKHK